MSGVKVDLNKRNLCIYESKPYRPSLDTTDFSNIYTVYIPVNIAVSLTTGVSSGNYVIYNSGAPTTPNSGTFNTSFIYPKTDGSTVSISDSTTNQITSYVSYNSGSDVTVNGGDGTASNSNGNLFTIFEVYDYIINKLDAFNNAMTYVQRCDQYTKLSYNMGLDQKQLSLGKGNYSDNDTSCAMFASTSIVAATQQRQPNGTPYFDANAKVFKSNLYNNSGSYDYLKGIPAWASPVVKKPDLKTQPYIDTTKSLMQQLADLINLTKNYQTILETYKKSSGGINYVMGADGSTQIPLNGTVTNSYNFSLTNLSDKVDILRNQLDNRVAEILASQSSSVYQSQMLKDSSVYANVMWTILATSLIYYVFVKL